MEFSIPIHSGLWNLWISKHAHMVLVRQTASCGFWCRSKPWLDQPGGSPDSIQLWFLCEFTKIRATGMRHDPATHVWTSRTSWKVFAVTRNGWFGDHWDDLSWLRVAGSVLSCPSADAASKVPDIPLGLKQQPRHGKSCRTIEFFFS